MAYVYQNLIVSERLDVKTDVGRIVTSAKGDLLTDNGTQSLRLGVGTDGQTLVANSATITGLEWQTLTPATIGLVAGTGLTLTGDTLNAVGSDTIIANADSLEVNSSGTANQVLLSAGTVGTSATYGAVPLANAASVTGILPVANGGTGSDGTEFAAGSRIVATNAGNTALETTTLDPATVVTLAGTETLTNKTLTTPSIGTSINDTNGNELVTVTATPAAVNEITLANAATGTAPSITASGDDANISLNLNAKGTGNVNISGLVYPNADGTVGQVLATNGAGNLAFVDVPVLSTGTETTTDATPTIIAAVTIPTTADTTYFVEAKFLGRVPTTGVSSSFIIKATFSNTAGTLILVGDDLMYTPVTTTWLAEVVPSTTDIIFRVTGAGATTIRWKAEVETMTINDAGL